MTHDANRAGDDALAAFFDAARRDAPLPAPDLMVRLQVEALREQPVPVLRRTRASWRDTLRALGGWPSATGLAAAACVGLWIGANPPDAVLTLLDGTDTVQALDPLSGFDVAMLGG